MKPLSIIAIVLSTTALFIAIFFHPPSANQGNSHLRDALQNGRINVGVIAAPPISNYDPSNSIADGYSIDVVRAMASKAKLELTFTPVGWDTMTAALDTEKIDVVAGPTFLTEARARDYLFSDPLFAYAVVAVVLKGAPKPRELNDLKLPGLRIAVGRGGFDAEFVTRFMPQALPSVFPSNDATITGLEVVSKRADLALMDYQTAVKFVKEHPEAEIRFESNPISLQYAGYMFRKRDHQLRDFWNVAMRNLDLDGELRALDDRYATQRSWYARLANRPR